MTNTEGTDLSSAFTSYDQADPLKGFRRAVLSGNSTLLSDYLDIDVDSTESYFGLFGYTTDPVETNKIEAVQMAHHPFHASHGVQPYYSFKCLDKARDTKAQIRLFIREWDRNFDKNNSYLSQSSDFSSTGTRYMDLYNEAQDVTERWNDFDDFDDFFLDNGVFTNNGERCILSSNSDVDNDGIFDPRAGDSHSHDNFPKIEFEN